METTIATRYTRSIRIDAHFYELQPGDQVDISEDMTQDWATIVRIGKHFHDPDRCDGDCLSVIHFKGEVGTVPWHIQDSDEIYARFPAVAE